VSPAARRSGAENDGYFRLATAILNGRRLPGMFLTAFTKRIAEHLEVA